jgi:hypothetical protein
VGTERTGTTLLKKQSGERSSWEEMPCSFENVASASHWLRTSICPAATLAAFLFGCLP